MPLPRKGGGRELIRWLVDPTHTMDSTVSAENQCPQYVKHYHRDRSIILQLKLLFLFTISAFYEHKSSADFYLYGIPAGYSVNADLRLTVLTL